MKNEKYETPKLEIIVFNQKDIITTSGGDDFFGDLDDILGGGSDGGVDTPSVPVN